MQSHHRKFGRPIASIAAVLFFAGLTSTSLTQAAASEMSLAKLNERVVVGDSSPAPSKESLDIVVKWIAVEFGLPELYAHPRIAFASPLKLMGMRYKSLLPVQQTQMESPGNASVMREVVAVYDDRALTIHLPESWTGASVTERSVLVHEMVHHLQNLGKLTYECPAAREKIAYEAQGQFLSQHGKSLEEEFEVDMMTLLVSSSCMF